MDYRQQEVISRAKSLRQRFADSRTSTSSSISTSPLITTRWQSHHHQPFYPEGSSAAVGNDASSALGSGSASLKPQFSDVPTPAGSKSPSPSRWWCINEWFCFIECSQASSRKIYLIEIYFFFKTISTDQRTSIKSNEKRPSSVSWMVTNPRGHCSRPGTPTAGYPLDTCAISSAVAAAASLVAATASSVPVSTGLLSTGAQQVRQMSDDFAADLVTEPSYLYGSSKVSKYEKKNYDISFVIFVCCLRCRNCIRISISITLVSVIPARLKYGKSGNGMDRS